jgi:hypothetical protein
MGIGGRGIEMSIERGGDDWLVEMPRLDVVHGMTSGIYQFEWTRQHRIALLAEYWGKLVCIQCMLYYKLEWKIWRNGSIMRTGYIHRENYDKDGKVVCVRFRMCSFFSAGGR